MPNPLETAKDLVGKTLAGLATLPKTAIGAITRRARPPSPRAEADDGFGIPDVDGLHGGSIDKRAFASASKPSADGVVARVARAKGRMGDAIARNPLLAIVPAAALVVVGLCVVFVMISYLPPAEIGSSDARASKEARELLDSFVVPFDDPLDPEPALARPRKARYNRSEAERAWFDIGTVDVSEAGRKNREDLNELFSVIE